MKGFIDRIEDGRIAVVIFENGGKLNLPADAFPFAIHEGMHLKAELVPDPESEEESRKKIRGLQQELIKRTEDKRSEVEEEE